MRKNWSSIGWLVFGFVVVALLFLMACGVEGRTITVDDDGEAEFTSIQDAINVSVDGDSVQVWDGEYREALIVNKSISIIGNGSEKTSLNSDSELATITLISNLISIQGFTIANELWLGDGIYSNIS